MLEQERLQPLLAVESPEKSPLWMRNFGYAWWLRGDLPVR